MEPYQVLGNNPAEATKADVVSLKGKANVQKIIATRTTVRFLPQHSDAIRASQPHRLIGKLTEKEKHSVATAAVAINVRLPVSANSQSIPLY